MAQPKKLFAKDIITPADVPAEAKESYIRNFLAMTRNTGRLMLFAGDQKIEHLNDDFYGTIKEHGSEKRIPSDDADPEHLFRIASKGAIGAFATQLGLIAKYGPSYRDVNYIVKINSRSHLVGVGQAEPVSSSLVELEDVLALRRSSGLNIVGVGYTVYVGSDKESSMLAEAGRLATKAHQNGLLAIFWMYPRGKAVPNEKDPHIVAGAAGVGACLGADFVKVNYPKVNEGSTAEAFREAVLAAGSRTGLITAGGSLKPAREFLHETWEQINVSGCRGNATGRNIHQKPLDEAVRLCNAISAIIFAGKDVAFALKVYEGTEQCLV